MTVCRVGLTILSVNLHKRPRNLEPGKDFSRKKRGLSLGKKVLKDSCVLEVFIPQGLKIVFISPKKIVVAQQSGQPCVHK